MSKSEVQHLREQVEPTSFGEGLRSQIAMYAFVRQSTMASSLSGRFTKPNCKMWVKGRGFQKGTLMKWC